MHLGRLLLASGLAAAAASAGAAAAPIDRQALVARHALEWNEPAGQVPLGNGEFCFNADGTGLQTLGGSTMAHWAWHSFPLPAGWTPERVPATATFMHERNPGPDVFPAGTEALRKWMFDNPHSMNLGRLRLGRPGGAALQADEIADLHRTLDLWTGRQTSAYRVGGQPVRVETSVDPALDAVAVRIESPLVAEGKLEVTLDFPYPDLKNNAWVGDFSRAEGHNTELMRPGARRADFARIVDDTKYFASLAWSPGAALAAATNSPRRKLTIRKAEYGGKDKWLDVTEKVAARIVSDGLSVTPGYGWLGDPLPAQAKRLKLTYVRGGEEKTVEVLDGAQFVIRGGGAAPSYTLSAPGGPRLEFVCAFSAAKLPGELPRVGKSFEDSSKHWKEFWSTGGAIDLSGSKDPRWMELERRIVLSQYLLAAQSAGSWPSAETGLMGIDSWRGQFHMEMVWWHLAHYALWDRGTMSERALGCYQRFAATARARAEQLGHRGLLWGKSCGPEGRSAPWAGNLALLWKQPHPIFFAELEYRARPTKATLGKWGAIVEGTAEYMADFPVRDAATGLYSLAPAMPPSEQGFTRDTVFDLAYWRWGLDKAQEWRVRRGLAREPRWDEVRRHLAPLPAQDGVFMHSAEWKDTYTKRAYEHPDPVGVLGMLPPMEGVDAETAHRTVLKVWEKWDWNKCWGWDFPWMAMAAARTGEPGLAVEALLKESPRNRYDTRGVNTGGPCPYLPGNGGLLYAVAMMAAGWDPASSGDSAGTGGAPKTHAPGFPADGSWTVRWEGLKPAP